MPYDEIVALLAHAGGRDLVVRVITVDGQEVTGVPASLDTHPAAHELYLRTEGDDALEVRVLLEGIARVEVLGT